MAEKEIHTVGLGEVRRVAPRNRASKAMKILKEYVERHSGAETVSVSNALNEHIWGKGATNPPKSVEIQVLVDEGRAHVELADIEFELPEEEEEVEAEAPAEDLTDEEIAEKNVGEVKDLVESGAVEAERALDIEYAGKNRKTIIEWLQRLVQSDEDGAEEHEQTAPIEGRVGEEPEEEEESEAAPEDVEEAEEEEDEAVEEEASDETYDLPDDVVQVLEDGTIGDGKEAAKELGKSEFEKLLNFEEAHQNRKGMKKWLRSNMN